MTQPEYYTYIVASKTRVLYVGITNNLQRRMREHVTKARDGFTAKYNINRLVWYMAFRHVSGSAGVGRSAVAGESSAWWRPLRKRER